MEWMNPYLEPHGLIFKLNRQPVATISDEIISRDHAYWAQLIKPMIGDWLTESTSTTEIAAFIEKTYRRQDLNGFRGDLHFIQNAYSQRIFSESRLAIAALYRWHADHATDPADKKRMLEEADLAFRQAWGAGALIRCKLCAGMLISCWIKIRMRLPYWLQIRPKPCHRTKTMI